jgi:hypothetical protein
MEGVMVSSLAQSLVTSRRLQCLVLASILCVLGASKAWADGPVATIPGGVSFTDDDNVGGQKWGRPGGRNFNYSVNNPANFSALRWGLVNGTSPGAAFDNSISGNTPEVFTFDGGSSDLAGGVARFVGSGVVPLSGGGLTGPVQTRFTMTVTSNNVPVTLTFINGNVSPGIDALTTTTFKVNLLFEAFDGAQWKPILDFYDAVATPAANPSPASGPALTQVQVGFYYTAASSGGTQLDTIQTDVTTIKTDVNQLKVDSGIVQTNLTNLSLALGGVTAQLATLSSQLPPDLAANLAAAVQQIGNANTTLSGLQTALSGLLNTLDVTAYKEYRTDTKKVWLVTTMYEGALANGTLVKALAVVPKTTGAATVFDVTGVATVAQIMPGVLEVTLSSVPTGAQTFQFQMQYVPAAGITATGSVMLP